MIVRQSDATFTGRAQFVIARAAACVGNASNVVALFANRTRSYILFCRADVTCIVVQTFSEERL